MHKFFILLCLAYTSHGSERLKNFNYHKNNCNFVNFNIQRDLYSPDEYDAQEYENKCLNDSPIIIPIGSDCFSAHRLRLIGVRKLAYPFDWYQSSLETIYNCILNDFAHFTDERYILHENNYYYHSIYKMIFFHDFTNDTKRFPQELANMKQKYNTRISRFYKALQIKKPIYLLYTAPDYWTSEKTTITFNKIWLNKLTTLLKQKFPTVSITIIYADFSPQTIELQNIPLVKAYKIKYHMHPQAKPNKQLIAEEWHTILKDVGIPL